MKTIIAISFIMVIMSSSVSFADGKEEVFPIEEMFVNKQEAYELTKKENEKLKLEYDAIELKYIKETQYIKELIQRIDDKELEIKRLMKVKPEIKKVKVVDYSITFWVAVIVGVIGLML
jgi:hypothetical protein